MTDQVANIAKGAFIEKFRDGAANGLILLLTANEADDALLDHDNISVLLGAAGNTEAVDASYARKTGITGTITVDDTNNRTDLDFPDQVFTALAGAAITKAITGYEETASDTGRVFMFHHDFGVTPDSSDVTLQVNAAGIARAA